MTVSKSGLLILITFLTVVSVEGQAFRARGFPSSSASAPLGSQSIVISTSDGDDVSTTGETFDHGTTGESLTTGGDDDKGTTGESEYSTTGEQLVTTGEEVGTTGEDIGTTGEKLATSGDTATTGQEAATTDRAVQPVITTGEDAATTGERLTTGEQAETTGERLTTGEQAETTGERFTTGEQQVGTSGEQQQQAGTTAAQAGLPASSTTVPVPSSTTGSVLLSGSSTGVVSVPGATSAGATTASGGQAGSSSTGAPVVVGSTTGRVPETVAPQAPVIAKSISCETNTYTFACSQAASYVAQGFRFNWTVFADGVFYQSGSQANISLSALEANVARLRVHLSVIDVHGVSNTAQMETSVNAETPAVTIVAADTYSMLSSLDLTLDSVASMSACGNFTSRVLVFQWSQLNSSATTTSSSAPLLNLSSLVTNFHALRVPKNRLVPGATYTFLLTVYPTGLPSAATSAQWSVGVVAVAPLAVIGGGNRAAFVGDTLVLSANRSIDYNGRNDFSFNWTIGVEGSAPAAVNNGLLVASASGTVATVAGWQLNAGTYRVTLVATLLSSGLSDTATTLVEMVEHAVLDVSIQALSTRNPLASSRLRLQGSAYDSSALAATISYQWSSTQLTLLPPYVSSSSQSTLAIYSGLEAGTTYTFTLTARTGNTTGWATMTFTTMANPVVTSNFAVTPASGDAFTEYTLSAPLVTYDASTGPLQYAYFYRLDGQEEEQVLVPPQLSPVSSFVLPIMRSASVNVTLRAYNALGGFGSSSVRLPLTAVATPVSSAAAAAFAETYIQTDIQPTFNDGQTGLALLKLNVVSLYIDYANVSAADASRLKTMLLQVTAKCVLANGAQGGFSEQASSQQMASLQAAIASPNSGDFPQLALDIFQATLNNVALPQDQPVSALVTNLAASVINSLLRQLLSSSSLPANKLLQQQLNNKRAAPASSPAQSLLSVIDTLFMLQLWNRDCGEPGVHSEQTAFSVFTQVMASSAANNSIHSSLASFAGLQGLFSGGAQCVTARMFTTQLDLGTSSDDSTLGDNHGPVVSLVIDGADTSSLVQPVTVVIALDPNLTNPTLDCSYRHNTSYVWQSDASCTKVSQTSDALTCSCTHLTEFRASTAGGLVGSSNAQPGNARSAPSYLAYVLPIACVALLAVAAVAGIALMRRQRQHKKQQQQQQRQQQASKQASPGDGSVGARLYSASDIVLLGVVDEKSYGPLYKGLLGGERRVVLKEITKRAAEDRAFQNRLQVLARLDMQRRERLVPVLGMYVRHTSETNMHYYVVLDVQWKGNVLEYMASLKHKMSMRQLLHIASDVATALAYLEQHGIVHGDVAARNVLVTRSTDSSSSSVRALLADYDISAALRTRESNVKWTAPEIALAANGKASADGDAWSFGVLLWELLYDGAVPYGDLSDEEYLRVLANGHRLPTPTADDKHVPPALIRTMQMCWSEEPSHRPIFKQIVDVLQRILDELPPATAANDDDDERSRQDTSDYFDSASSDDDESTQQQQQQSMPEEEEEEEAEFMRVRAAPDTSDGEKGSSDDSELSESFINCRPVGGQMVRESSTSEWESSSMRKMAPSLSIMSNSSTGSARRQPIYKQRSVIRHRSRSAFSIHDLAAAVAQSDDSDSDKQQQQQQHTARQQPARSRSFARSVSLAAAAAVSKVVSGEYENEHDSDDEDDAVASKIEAELERRANMIKRSSGRQFNRMSKRYSRRISVSDDESDAAPTHNNNDDDTPAPPPSYSGIFNNNSSAAQPATPGDVASDWHFVAQSEEGEEKEEEQPVRSVARTSSEEIIISDDAQQANNNNQQLNRTLSESIKSIRTKQKNNKSAEAVQARLGAEFKELRKDWDHFQQSRSSASSSSAEESTFEESDSEDSFSATATTTPQHSSATVRASIVEARRQQLQQSLDHAPLSPSQQHRRPSHVAPGVVVAGRSSSSELQGLERVRDQVKNFQSVERSDAQLMDSEPEEPPTTTTTTIGGAPRRLLKRRPESNSPSPVISRASQPEREN